MESEQGYKVVKIQYLLLLTTVYTIGKTLFLTTAFILFGFLREVKHIKKADKAQKVIFTKCALTMSRSEKG